MADFRLAVRFENPSCIAIYVVEADDEQSACGEFSKKYNQEVLRLEKFNVFVSKRMVGCVPIASKDHIQFIDDHGDLILPPGDVQLLPARP